MRETELYGHLLGLELPWTVTRVELSLKGATGADRPHGCG